jgi:hypothetical protein
VSHASTSPDPNPAGAQSDPLIVDERLVARLHTLDVDGPKSVPVAVWFRYDLREPWLVTLSFQAAGGRFVDWIIERNLLCDGVLVGAGIGDIRIQRGLDHGGFDQAWITLSSPSGRADFSFDYRTLVDLIGRTEQAVPLGAENSRVDIDAELRALLGSAS